MRPRWLVGPRNGHARFVRSRLGPKADEARRKTRLLAEAAKGALLPNHGAIALSCSWTCVGSLTDRFGDGQAHHLFPLHLHLPDPVAAGTEEPGTLQRGDFRVGPAANLRGHQVSRPITLRVRAGDWITAEHDVDPLE